MTIHILPNTLSIPIRSVIVSGKGKFIRVLGPDKVVQEIPIQTGLRDASGNVEVLQGLAEGDRIILFEKGS